MIFTAWRIMDIGIFLFFLLLFRPRWVGIIIGILYGYRLMKSFLPGGNSLVHKLVDCSQHHTAYDGHRHIGAVPKGHDHRDDRPSKRKGRLP